MIYRIMNDIWNRIAVIPQLHYRDLILLHVVPRYPRALPSRPYIFGTRP